VKVNRFDDMRTLRKKYVKMKDSSMIATVGGGMTPHPLILKILAVTFPTL